jgi:hypothetical protein
VFSGYLNSGQLTECRNRVVQAACIETLICVRFRIVDETVTVGLEIAVVLRFSRCPEQTSDFA